MIATAGFLLFALPSVGGSYWKTFFPAFIVLGLGMAVSVAPLTTVVMASVEQDRAGTASGVNNAVARVAGVLAVAILGAVMVEAFGHELRRSLTGLNLPASVLSELQGKLVQLGGLQVPAGLDPSKTAAVRDDIAHAFVFAFRIIMVTCAGLALASAAVARRMIPSE
jgi:MFS family permease